MLSTIQGAAIDSPVHNLKALLFLRRSDMATDPWSKLAYFMPTGTFLTFQVLAPLTTYVPEGGDCKPVQYALTGVFLGIMATFCFLMSFTDSITDANGKIRYGIVTPWGLWWSRVDWAPAQEPHAQPLEQGQGDEHQGHGHDENGQLAAADPKLADEAADQPPAGGNNPPPQAAPLPVVTMVPALPTDKKYKLRWEDWVHAVISVCTFVALALLTPPVSTCYFKNHLAPNISITVPIFVGILASVAFTFIGPPRNGIGFPNQDLAAAADAVRQANPQIIIHLPPAAAAAAVAGNSLVAGTP